MNHLLPITNDEALKREKEQTITSLEIAEMMETEHSKLLRKLEGDDTRKGIIPILGEAQMGVTDYFIKSTYLTSQNKEMPCYLVTKMGRDFLANKFTGEKGILFTARYVKRFHEMEDVISSKPQDTALIGLQFVKFIADDLRVAESSRLFMYENYCKDVGIPTGFLPKYEDNGSRERLPATELLKRNCCGISAVKFNQLLLKAGYLEEKERSSSKGGTKKYKALTEKGLQYGINLISDKNQKETQPYYYSDMFRELLEKVI